MKKTNVIRLWAVCSFLFSSCLPGAPASYAGDGGSSASLPVIIDPNLESVAYAPIPPGLDATFPDTSYCFEQTSFRGNLANATLDHTLVIPRDDQLKTGDVFVGFRLKSNPAVVLLKSAFDDWSSYDGSGEPVAYMSNSPLWPVIRVNVIRQPIDLTAYAGDGEVVVGYGLRTAPDATLGDSFRDMMANRRYSVVWNTEPWSSNQWLCLNVTGVVFPVVHIGINLPYPVVVAPPSPPSAPAGQ